MTPVTISVAAMCEQLSIGRTKAAEIIKNGQVATIRIGRRRLVLISSIHEMVAAAAAAHQGNL